MMKPMTFLVAALAALTLVGWGNDGPATRAATDDAGRADHEAHEDHNHDDRDHEGRGDHDDHDDHDRERRGDHDDHDDHEEDEHEHDDHADHGDDEHADHVELSTAAAAEAGIAVSRAERSLSTQTLSLPAELRYDADRVAVVSPQISGRIIRLNATEGDTVARGATLAVISSRELADLKADYLSAATAEDLARQALDREEMLFADRITSQADLQSARAALAAARADLEGVENKLHAVGVSDAVLSRLSDATHGTLANVSLTAPIGGIVARRTATLGANVSADDAGAPALFTIVDDSVLWADIAVYNQDAGSVETGATVRLRSDNGDLLAEGVIATVLPAIDETSRTATARMVVDNDARRMRPGQFVTAEIAIGAGGSALQVPSRAIIQVEGRTSVFVPTADGFMPREVVTGVTTGGRTVILSGLSESEEFVSDGAFTLKAQLEKDAFGDGHVH